MPKSVPLRAIVTTSVEPGTSRAASVASLPAGMPRLRKKWSLPPTNRATSAMSDDGASTPTSAGRMLAQEHQRAGAVAVVPLVAHLQHLGDDRLDVDRPGCARTACCSTGPSTAAIQRSRLDHLGAVGAVAQHLAEALVERAAGLAAVHRVLQLEHPHRRRDHAGHRADGAVVVARVEGDRRRGRARARPPRGCRPAPRRACAPISAPRIGPEARSQRQRRAGVEERAAFEAEHLAGGPDVDQLGAGREQPLDRRAVGLLAAGVGEDPGQVGLGAGHRRAPVDLGDLGGLGAQGVGEEARRRRRRRPARRRAARAGGWWSASWQDLLGRSGGQ